VTDSGAAGTDRTLPRAVIGLLIVVAIAGGVGVGVLMASGWSDARPAVAQISPSPGATAAAPTPAATPPPTARPTPAPTPLTVPAPLTGLPVSPESAMWHPIAVMVDDHRDARPQSGFNAAAVVWQAPAEGGIPRYMLVFQDSLSAAVGPIRSARQYYIEWASEWNAVYVHVGGSPGAMATLASAGRGQLVWNADEFRWAGTYIWRVPERAAPHNTYSDGEQLRALSAAVGATDGPIEPAWTFGPAARPAARPVGTTLAVTYPYGTIEYRYDAGTNTYRRYIDGSAEPQVDAADGRVVAPANVVILRMRFGALNDGHPEKHRLDAEDVGSGEAIISTNGRIVTGTWSKASVSGPTLLFGPDGEPVRLTAGQTFVQVIALSYPYEVTEGTVPGRGTQLP
jgi:hypothetical protein